MISEIKKNDIPNTTNYIPKLVFNRMKQKDHTTNNTILGYHFCVWVIIFILWNMLDSFFIIRNVFFFLFNYMFLVLGFICNIWDVIF